jgi:hypothetical protein
MPRALAILTLLTVFACRTVPCPQERAGDDEVNIPRHAFALAETNRAHIDKVRLGQTLVEVERIMGPPEQRAARLRYDNVSVEEWSYITDYVRKADALILFVGGKVAEIQAAPWEEHD